MSQKKSWTKPLALAISLPSTIFFTAYALKVLVEKNVLSPWVGILLFLAIVGNSLVLMVIYAYKK